MSGLVVSNISSSLVRENVAGAPIDTVFRRTDFLNFLMAKGAVRPWAGAYPRGWNIVWAANSSAETFVEGQAAPVAGKQSYARAQLSPFYTRVIAEHSGHVADQVAHGGTYADALQIELAKGIEDLWVKVESSLLSTTADVGAQSVFDAGDTYANLAPGTYTTHASIETAVSGVLSMTVIEDNLEAGALLKARPTDILCCQNQITNYVRLLGPSAGTSLMRYAAGTTDYGAMQGGAQGAYLGGANAVNGMPLWGISGLTNTVILMLDMASPGPDGGKGVELLTFRDIEVLPFGRTSDSQTYQISTACALFAYERRAHIKLTGVTA